MTPVEANSLAIDSSPVEMTTLHSAPFDTELFTFVLVDGARPDVIDQLLASGQLPNIKRYLTHGGSSLTAVTCLPSTTSLAYLPMLTGHYPGTANVPGTRWMEKEIFGAGGVFPSGHRSYCGAGWAHFSGDISEEVETVFELCTESLAYRSEIQRGLPPSQNRHFFLSGPLVTIGHYLHRTDFVDRWLVRGLCQELKRSNGKRPQFVFLPLTNVDSRSHGYGPHSRQAVDAYRGIDDGIGAIISTLKGIGLWAKTKLLISSDHGHTATSSHLDLSRMVEEAGYRVFEYPMIYRRNCTAAVMISGNSLAHVYLASGDRWEGPLSGERLVGEHAKLLEQLKSREEVEWIAFRHQDGRVVIDSGPGQGVLGMTEEVYNYHWQGRDPLQLNLEHSTVPRDQSLAQTAETPFPDALEQLWHLFRSHRTGDIVVTAKAGYDLRARYEWPEHHSSHGALCRDQMLVPLLSNWPLDGGSPIRTVDIFPTIVRSLGLKPGKPQFGRFLT